jgi:hypothetical protein
MWSRLGRADSARVYASRVRTAWYGADSRYCRFFAALFVESGRDAGTVDGTGVVPAGGPPLVTDAMPEPEPVGPLLMPGLG